MYANTITTTSLLEGNIFKIHCLLFTIFPSFSLLYVLTCWSSLFFSQRTHKYEEKNGKSQCVVLSHHLLPLKTASFDDIRHYLIRPRLHFLNKTRLPFILAPTCVLCYTMKVSPQIHITSCFSHDITFLHQQHLTIYTSLLY